MIDTSAFVKTLQGKPAAVFGLARSGLSTIRALKNAGAEVIAWDDKTESHAQARKAGATVKPLDAERLKTCGILILAPGVPLYYPAPHPVVAAAKEARLEIICDIELFYRCRPKHLKIAGVTGTNGKSTTTALLGHVLNECGHDAVIGGNIGLPVLDLDIPLTTQVAVLELSSYQLDLCPTFKPDVAILLNITPDHLDRHGAMENYIAAKEKMFHGPGVAIVATDDEYTHEVAKRIRERKLISVSMNDITVDAGNLRGEHNHQNMAAVMAAAKSLGCKEADIRKAFETFPGLAHRQYPVRSINGVAYINDSKATNAEAASKALSSFENIYWIVGGRQKGDDWNVMLPFLGRVKHAYLIGESAEEFAAWLKQNDVAYTVSKTLEVATRDAHEAAQKSHGQPGGEVVLLSPACASFDQFSSFEERGEHFESIVKSLKEVAAA